MSFKKLKYFVLAAGLLLPLSQPPLWASVPAAHTFRLGDVTTGSLLLARDGASDPGASEKKATTERCPPGNPSCAQVTENTEPKADPKKKKRKIDNCETGGTGPNCPR